MGKQVTNIASGNATVGFQVGTIGGKPVKPAKAKNVVKDNAKVGKQSK